MRFAAALLIAVALAGCGGGDDGSGGARGRAAAGGSQLKILEDVPGSGPEAAPGDWISVHYTGWVAQSQGQPRGQGTVRSKGPQFDGSRERGQPLVVRLTDRVVIEGWVEGISGMRVGGRRTFLVPPELAYGPRSVGQIPALSWLIFEVELLDMPRVQVEDLAAGQGIDAAAGDTLDVLYCGWLAEEGRKGRRFDPPGGDGEPAREAFRFVLGADQVIPGWDLGLKGMQAGGSRRLTIPPELAYGAFGSIRSGEIVVPPGATLIYEVELVRLDRPGAPAAPLP